MVCDRCRMVVRSVLEQQGFHPLSVQLGEVELAEDRIDDLKSGLADELHRLGFELLDDRKSRLVEQIKNQIIDLIHYQHDVIKTNLSTWLSNTLHFDYGYLSNLFSEAEGTTIEKYFIAQKIEKVKELLLYDELSLSEIAYQLHYSSVAYLSNQFKKITGLTPGQFRQAQVKSRIPLDKV